MKTLKRKKMVKKDDGGGRYFGASEAVDFVSTGCRTLDRVLGGGWALGRVGNIIGDESTGKTLMVIEAFANFAIQYPDPKKHKMRYREAEEAFDEDYAETVGLPRERVELNPEFTMLVPAVSKTGQNLKPKEVVCDAVDTVHELFADIMDFINSVPDGGAGVYAVDSLDAIGDADEMNGIFGKQSYGTAKAKQLGVLFRRVVREAGKKNVLLLIVSQTRDKIGIVYGDKQSVSGGRALRYYSTHRVWLAGSKQLVVDIKGIKRPVGLQILAKCKKNKIAAPHRQCPIIIRYGYGIDEFESSVHWLKEVKRLGRAGIDKTQVAKYLKAVDKMTPDEVKKERARLYGVVDKCWYEVERMFAPTRKKYA